MNGDLETGRSLLEAGPSQLASSARIAECEQRGLQSVEEDIMSRLREPSAVDLWQVKIGDKYVPLCVCWRGATNEL